MAGLGGMAGDVAYTATKHAVVGLVKSLGATLEQSGHGGVCVSALCPGFVNTPLVPEHAQTMISAMGIPVIDPSQVAEAAMQALDAKVNGSQWIVWGDTIRRHEQTPFDLT
jgi:NAD(P)-dependent dehydrogenase (short-subunit alcohol dehydrogenase family)